MKAHGGILHRITVLAVVVLGVGFGVGVTHADVKTVNVSCNNGESIGKALEQGDERKPLVVVVQGICSENVVIGRDDVTLRGHEGGGGVTGLDPTKDTILIDGARRVVLERLIVTGGKNGIVGRRGASFGVLNSTIHDSTGPLSDGNGIKLHQNSHALIHGNSIEGHPVSGINVTAGGNATITANTIRRNNDTGVLVFNSGSVRIGLTEEETEAGNLIEENCFDGIVIHDASSGVLYGNTIQNNGVAGGICVGDGIFVGRNSSLRMVGRNTIRFNGRGIFLRDAHLRTGRGSFGITPNNEEISNNSPIGILAEDNSTLDLREGMVVTNNGPGFGVDLRHGSRAQMRGVTVSGNVAGGVIVEFGSSVRFIGAAVRITGNGGVGLHCADAESSFDGGFIGGGNAFGDVNPPCTGF